MVQQSVQDQAAQTQLHSLQNQQQNNMRQKNYLPCHQISNQPGTQILLL